LRRLARIRASNRAPRPRIRYQAPGNHAEEVEMNVVSPVISQDTIDSVTIPTARASKISVMVNHSIQLDAVVDTGSEVTIISTSALSHLSNVYKYPCPFGHPGVLFPGDLHW